MKEKWKPSWVMRTMHPFLVLRPDSYFPNGLLWADGVSLEEQVQRASRRWWHHATMHFGNSTSAGVTVMCVSEWGSLRWDLVVCRQILYNSVFLLNTPAVPPAWNPDKRPSPSRNMLCKLLSSIWLLRIISNSSWTAVISIQTLGVCWWELSWKMRVNVKNAW